MGRGRRLDRNDQGCPPADRRIRETAAPKFSYRQRGGLKQRRRRDFDGVSDAS